jgi:ribosomal protein L2
MFFWANGIEFNDPTEYAENPVDHPHGGRNKAIKYQRTP